MDREQLLTFLAKKGLPSTMADIIDLTKINSEEDLEKVVGKLITKPTTVEGMLADPDLNKLANSHGDKRVTDGIKTHEEKKKKEKEDQQQQSSSEEVPEWFKAYQKKQDEFNSGLQTKFDKQDKEAKLAQNKKMLKTVASGKKLKSDYLKLVTVSEDDTEESLKAKVDGVIEIVGDSAKEIEEDPARIGLNPRPAQNAKQQQKAISDAFAKEQPIETKEK